VSKQHRLLTIGYEGTTQALVLDALRQAGARHLIDVRALPQSRKPGFSKRLLAASLAEAGLRYTHLRGLGTPKAGRDAVRRGDVETMRRIYAAQLETPEARHDLELARGIAGAEPACLLCFERDHTHCHRDIVAHLICDDASLPLVHLRASLPS
jgi:uncharacterized protein (DUF488 family)